MKKVYIFFFFLLFFLLTSCCANNNDDVWIVGTSADNPPYEFIQNGKVIGFDIDFVNELKKLLKKKVEFKNMDFYNLFAALSTYRIHLAVAGLSFSPERLSKVDFSIPYISARLAVLYKKEGKFTSCKDLRNKKVGVQLGTIWKAIAIRLAKKHGFTIISLSSNLTLIEELKLRRIDALFLEEAQAKKLVELYPDLDKFTKNNTHSSFSIAMPKNSSYKNDIDQAIRELRANGIIEGLARKWGLSNEK